MDEIGYTCCRGHASTENSQFNVRLHEQRSSQPTGVKSEVTFHEWRHVGSQSRRLSLCLHDRLYILREVLHSQKGVKLLSGVPLASVHPTTCNLQCLTSSSLVSGLGKSRLGVGAASARYRAVGAAAIPGLLCLTCISMLRRRHSETPYLLESLLAVLN